MKGQGFKIFTIVLINRKYLELMYVKIDFTVFKFSKYQAKAFK